MIETHRLKNVVIFFQTFTSDTDERFEWLLYAFLQYFTNWKLSMKNRDDFSQSEKEKMFIPW